MKPKPESMVSRRELSEQSVREETLLERNQKAEYPGQLALLLARNEGGDERAHSNFDNNKKFMA